MSNQRTCSVLRDLYLKLLNENDELNRDFAIVKPLSRAYILKSGIDNDDRATMVKNIDSINDIKKLYDYFCNSLLVFENRPYFYRISGCPFQRFKNICTDGKSDWDQ